MTNINRGWRAIRYKPRFGLLMDGTSGFFAPVAVLLKTITKSILMKPIVPILSITGVMLFAAATAHAQPALVGPEGYTNSFPNRPLATEWSTISAAGLAADVYDLTNLVQT